MEENSTIDFDIAGARKAGATNADISEYFKSNYGVDFDVDGATKAGATDADILGYVNQNYGSVKKKESTNPIQSATTSTNSNAPATPSATSGEEIEPIDLPKTYQDNRSNYKDLVGGGKYKLNRGGIPITGTWDAENQQFLKDPVLNFTPQQIKKGAGEELVAPNVPKFESTDEVLSRNFEKSKAVSEEAAVKAKAVNQLSAIPQIQQIQALKDEGKTEEAKKIEEQPITAEDFPAVRLERGGESKVLQNLQTNLPVEEYKGDNLIPVKPEKLLPQGYEDVKTFGDLYSKVKEDEDYVKQVVPEVKKFDDVLKQQQVENLSDEDKDYLKKLEGTPFYDDELVKTLERTGTTDNLVKAAGIGLTKKIEDITKLGNNIGLSDKEWADKMERENAYDQLFRTKPEGMPAEVASSLGSMVPDIAAGAIFSPLMFASMGSTMVNDKLKEYYADAKQRGEIPNKQKAWEYAVTSTAAQTGAMGLAGKIGGESMKLMGETTLKRAGELLGEVAKRGAKDAALFGVGATYLQNQINRAFNVSQKEGYLNGALHMAVIGTLFGLKEGMGKVRISESKNNEIDYMASKLPPTVTEGQVNSLVKSGKISKEDGDDVLEKLNTYRMIRASMPNDITFVQAEKIYPLWKDKVDATNKMKSASPEFKSVLSGQIDDLDRKILIAGAVELSPLEKQEMRMLQMGEAENNPIDKSRLRYLEKRKAASDDVKQEKKEVESPKEEVVEKAEEPEKETVAETVAEGGMEEPVAEETKLEVKKKRRTFTQAAIDKQKEINALIDSAEKYNNLSKGTRGKGSSEGAKKRNEVKLEAERLGIKLRENGKMLTPVHGSNKKMHRNYFWESNQAPAENHTPLAQRSVETQKLFDALNEFGALAFPDIVGSDGKRMSLNQKESAIGDIHEKYGSIGAENLLNQLDEANRLGYIEVSDNAGGTASIPLDVVFEYLKNNSQEMTEEEIASAKAEFSALPEEQQQQIRNQYEADNENDRQANSFGDEKAQNELGNDSNDKEQVSESKKDDGATAKVGSDKARQATKDFLKKFGSADLPEGINKLGIDIDKVVDAVFDVYDASIEAGKTVKQAIEDAVKHFKGTDFYKGLKEENKKDAEDFIRGQVEDKGGKEAGVSAKAREQRAIDTATDVEDAGEGWTGADALDRGNKLIKEGTSPYNLTENKDLELHDKVAVAQAHSAELARATNLQGDLHGTDSQQYKDALQKELEYAKETKPLSTKAHLAFAAHQGAVDIDTGTWTGLERAFREEHGKEPTAAQKKEAEKLAGDVKDLTLKNAELEKRLYDALNKATEGDKKTYTQKSKEIADQFRKLKSKPITFKDAKGNEIKITQLSVVDWNGLVELGAKAIEKTGQIADGVKAIIDELKYHDWYAKLSAEDRDAVNSQIEGLFKVGKDDIAERFVDRTPNDYSFDAKDIKDIWKYAKENYIDKGVVDFGEMTQSVGDDLGLTQKQVIEALSKPKGTKQITDDMYRTQSRRRDAVNNAKVWVKSANEPAVTKVLKMLPSFWFRKAVFGHGTVGMVTHAGMNVFRPSDWKTYFPNFIRQFQFMSRVQHEKFMQGMEKEADFAFWKRNGLALDSHKNYNEYQATKSGVSSIPVVKQFKQIWDASNQMGNRGFDALKSYRYDQAKTIWNNLDPATKTPETAKSISQMVNAATGTVDTQFPSIVNSAFFAPRLEASRWKRLVKTPLKTAETISNWKNANVEDKVAAKLAMKRTGETLATMSAMLAVNSALLSLTGSKHKINYTDPTESDFLKFKVGDKKLDVSGGMLSTTSLIGSLVETSISEIEKKRGAAPQRAELMYKRLGQKARGMLSPFFATAADFATQRDFMGNVMPFSSDKPDKRHEKMTWGDYILKSQLPIPITAAYRDIQDAMKKEGVDAATAKNILSGIITGIVMGGTGAHIGDAHIKKEEKK